MIAQGPAAEGHQLLAAGRVQDAIRAFEAALKASPDHPKCLCGLAKARAAAGERDRALTVLDGLLARKPDHLEARSLRALLKAQAGDAGAAAELRSAAQDRRAGLEEHLNLALYLMAQREDAEADRELRLAVRAEARDPRPHLLLAELAGRRGEHPAAISALQKALAASPPGDPLPHVALARAYKAAGMGREAAAAYRDAIQRQRRDPALAEEAYRAAAEARAWDAAVQVVVLLREQHPDDARYAAWLQEATAALKAGGGKSAGARYEEGDAQAVDVEREIAHVNELLMRNPPTPPRVARDCAAILDRVLRVQPNHGDALVLMGLCWVIMRDWDAAEDFCKKALAAAAAAKNRQWKDSANRLLSRLEKAKKKVIEEVEARGVKVR